jgi:hypothetical protein
MRGLNIAVFLVVLISWPLKGAWAEQRIPKLPLFPTPFEQQATCFTCALGEIGWRVQGAYVLFGVEMREKEGKEPTVDLKLAEGATLDDALRDVMRQMPAYTLEVVSDHMVDIYPTGAKDDASDPLNLRVERFDFVDDRPGTLLNGPEAYISELRKRLVQRSKGPPYPVEYSSIIMVGMLEPRITLHLRDVTVRQILNAASEATQAFPPKLLPSCWSSLLHPDPVWAVGGTYSWRAFGCVPKDWKKYWKPAPAAVKTQ